MAERITIGISQEKLTAGQRIRVRRLETSGGGEFWLELPQGVAYGSEIQVFFAGKEYQLVIAQPRGQASRETPQAAPRAPEPAPRAPEPAPRTPERHRAAPNITGSLLIDRLPREPIFAGTPQFWDRVREELWESVQQKKEFAGTLIYEELPDGVLFYDIEKKWSGEFDNTMLDFNAGDAFWHTHPTDILQEANDEFSDQDREESTNAKKPLALFSFGKSSPGYIAQFLLLPNIVTLLANASLRGVIELERRGTLPPNLIKFGIRAKIYVPRIGELDILRVEEERPVNLSEAQPVGIDRYTTPAVDAVKKAAGTAYEASKGAANKVYVAGQNLYETGGGSAKEYLKSGAETAKDILESGSEAAKGLLQSGKAALNSEAAQNIVESGKDAVEGLLSAGKKLFGRKDKKDEPKAPEKKDKDNLDW